VSRRGRALGFGLAALLAAVVAAAIADGYGESVARGYGELRAVVVTSAALPAGRVIDPEARSALELRRVPVRFLPPATLRDPSQALGLVPAATIPAGSYLLASQLRPPHSRGPTLPLDGARRPVQIQVSGIEALAVAGSRPEGTKVDVVVTTEPSSSAGGRTYVAAAAVPLLALGPGPEGAEVGGTAAATLGLTRRQALRLIAAESFARQLTVLPAR
jgi:Flp pilus assembly protein CpaB